MGSRLRLKLGRGGGGDPLLQLPNIAAFYDFSKVAIGAISGLIEPIQGCNLAQTTGSRQPIGVDYLGSRCAYFDGSDDYMDALNPSRLLDGASGGTIIIIHAREDKVATQYPIFYAKASNTLQFAIGYRSTSTNAMRSSCRLNAETIANSPNSTENKANGAFTYAIATASKATGSITIKQRDIAKLSATGLDTNSNFTAIDPRLSIGSYYHATEASRTDYFKGWMKAAYIFKRALTDTEVSTIVEPYLLAKYGV